MSDDIRRIEDDIAAFDASYPPSVYQPPAPPPVVTTLTPNTVSAAAGPTTITVAGTGFVASSTIRVDGIAVPTVYVSATSLTTSYDPTAAGTTQFTVANGAAISNAVPFTVGAIVDDPAAYRVPDIKSWVDANPDWADEILAAERARGDAARVTLIDWLEGFIASRDEEPTP